jgi:hypothetical protein
LEEGETDCGIVTVIRLAGVLKIETTDLLDEIGWRPGPDRAGSYGPGD